MNSSVRASLMLLFATAADAQTTKPVIFKTLTDFEHCLQVALAGRAEHSSICVTTRSLSDLIKSAAKSGKTVHFSPVFGANRTTIRLKPVKNCPRLPLFSLRPIKPDRLLGLVKTYRGPEDERVTLPSIEGGTRRATFPATASQSATPTRHRRLSTPGPSLTLTHIC